MSNIYIFLINMNLRFKVLSHCAIFHSSCLAMVWRDKSHETLHSVTYLAVAEKVVRQVAETVA